MSSILVEERSGYAVLRINRPQQRNAMNRAARQALTAAYADLAGRFSVVVLTGTEQSFCSGVDLKEELADRQAGNDVARQEWVDTLLSLRAQPAILVAAVNGFALGGGLSLINVSDLAIAAKEAQIGMPEMGFAAYPGAAGPSTQITLTRKRAAWMVLTAERIDGDTAERWGLVNRSVPLSELEAEVDKLARRVAGFDKTALIASKRALDSIPGRMSDWTEIFDFGIGGQRSDPRGHNGPRRRHRPLLPRGAQPRSRFSGMSLPLAGITLLEATSLEAPLALRIAVAFAGRMAAALGAEVVRFEQESGDPIRDSEPRIGTDSALSIFLNAGKRVVPWRGPAHLDGELQAQVRSAHIMLLDQGAAAMAAQSNARVKALVSFFADRPNVPREASEFTVLALSGVLDTVGDPQREPLRLGGHQLAYAAGLSAYTGIVSAYFGMTRTDVAGAAHETVKVSLFDVAMWLNWKNLAAAASSGASPTRAGRSHQWQVLRCRDGWVALVFMEKDWSALQSLVGDGRLADPRFATEAGRNRHARELGDIVEERFWTLTRREIEALARASRLPIGAVWSPVDLTQDPHYLARGFLQTARTQTGETYLQPVLPVRWHRLDAAPAPVQASLQ